MKTIIINGTGKERERVLKNRLIKNTEEITRKQNSHVHGSSELILLTWPNSWQ
jgi:hypothetical protein